MKSFSKTNYSVRGYTLVEMIVAIGVLTLLGGVFFEVLRSGVVLSAKNTAVNAAHEEGRQGILRLTRDIHAAVSVPQLRDSNHDATYTATGSFNVISSAAVNGVAPTAAGVSFQNIAAGPNFVWKDPNNATMIMIKDCGAQASAGMRLVIPFWGIEDDITKLAGSTVSNHINVFLATGADAQVNPPAFGGTAYAITYFTNRVLYVVLNGTYVADPQGGYMLSGGNYVPYTSGNVQRYRYENGELHFFKQRYSSNGNGGGIFFWQDFATVARYISSPTPFYVPLNTGGSPNTKYVGVNLTARDPKSSNRGYLATAALLNTQIDYRSRITLYQ
ncbi:MAG: hypothetical protein QOI04_1216 [Verrucomicrobiota bacterium]|jgi:type II secretory pathway pseudopilin PulG